MNWKGILAAFLCLFALNANTYAIEFELDSMKYATTSDTTVEVITRVSPFHVVVPPSVSYLNKTYVVTAIGDSALRGTLIRDISLPNTITRVGNGCFNNCRNLKYFEFPASVRVIGHNVLSNCRYLTTIVFPPRLDSLGAFMIIGGRNPDLIVTLPSTLTEIEPGAFKNLRNFRGTLVIPPSVTTIGDSAFRCDDDSYFPYDKIILPESLQHIGNQSFYRCSNFSFNMPNSILTIGDEAFAYCKYSKLTLPSNVQSIGDMAFACCDSFKQVVFPNTLTEIGKYAFMQCSLLDTIVLPENMLTINVGVFASCNSLRSITFPRNLNRINVGAFTSCRSLEHLELPQTLTTISKNAFSYGGLKSLRIPASVTTFGDRVFENCDSLKSIYTEHLNPLRLRTTQYTFLRRTDLSACTLYVPMGSKSKYQIAETWKDFSNIVEVNMTALDQVQSHAPVPVYASETGLLQLSNLNGSRASVEVVDMKGVVRLRSEVSESESLSLNNLPRGLYLLRMTVQNQLFLNKMMVQ